MLLQCALVSPDSVGAIVLVSAVVLGPARCEPVLMQSPAVVLQVQPREAAEPLPASPATAYTAADALRPATPPQLAPRQRTAHASSDTE